MEYEVVFVCPYPTIDEKSDGMMQRIIKVDSLSTNSRIYLDLSFKRLRHRIDIFESERGDDVKVFRGNALLHFFKIYNIIRKSNKLYIHSGYSAEKIVPFLFLRKTIIWDVHGLAPEELRFQGKLVRSFAQRIISKILYSKAKHIVVVTKSMQKFLMESFGERQGFIVAPLIGELNISPDSTERNIIVYVGGTQKWQNIDKMIDTVKNSDISHEIYVPTSELDNITTRFSDCKNVLVSNAKKSELVEIYRRSLAGYIIRDDLILNNVSLPTKMMEYLSHGVIPLVDYAEIGDFYDYGYKCINIRDTNILKSLNLNKMREDNYEVMRKLLIDYNHGDSELEDMLKC
ncbi:glycosyltransferase family 4 protein [Deinococcus sp. Arct2-2]|uniref:glycosyltransferase family 4 protein n=1 Tax=Deinococcus sp. Arct2-2 TaxID=2568653 RepID=UPI0010A4768D|nr:glycosyltransferase family 4 protein [Deinococcus sp. Arct2-2]THF69522.1 glycosyltransferase family 4 protein [Deinococcus sp. Arct2-2]